MKYHIKLDKSSKDKRVEELLKLFTDKGIEVCDYTESREGRPVYFLAPRFIPEFKFPEEALVFGYSKMDLKNYVCLSDDEDFIRENNYLTALAQKELLINRFGRADQKILVVGYGKLTAQLERVLTEADLHILNFNHHKVAELKKRYGDKTYFETAPLGHFPIIINTVPKQVVKLYKAIKSVIYDLASPPYGFDFGKLNIKKLDYNIEPALPGRFYPDKAAKAVFDCMTKIIDGIALKENPPKDTIVLCLTASPCSYNKLIPILEGLCKKYTVIPVMSQSAGQTNRFLDIEEFKIRLREMTGNNIITSIAGSETLSSRKEIVASAVVPATGNTIAKLANAITDTPVTMAVKALMRNSKPCIIGISTNDALSGNAANIGLLLNRKNYFFVPYGQDDPQKKPFSMVCHFEKTIETIEAALQGKQLQPIIN